MLFFVWLARFNIPVFHQTGWCQLIIYLSHVFVFLSVWNVVSFTAERYIIVFHPLRKESYCTKKKARNVVYVLLLVSALIYAFVPVTSGVVVVNDHKSICMPLAKYYDFLTITTVIDTMLACIIPSIIIVVLNAKIILQLQRHQCKQTTLTQPFTPLVTEKHIQGPPRRSVFHTSVCLSGSVHIKFSTNRSVTPEEEVPLHDVTNNPSRKSTTLLTSSSLTTTPNSCHRLLRSRIQFRTAKMLLILSSVFVILNLPFHAFRVHAFVKHLFGSDAKAPKANIFWHELFQLVYFLNFGINFFIYSMCGRQFRVALVRLIRRFRRGSLQRKYRNKAQDVRTQLQ